MQYAKKQQQQTPQAEPQASTSSKAPRTITEEQYQAIAQALQGAPATWKERETRSHIHAQISLAETLHSRAHSEEKQPERESASKGLRRPLGGVERGYREGGLLGPSRSEYFDEYASGFGRSANFRDSRVDREVLPNDTRTALRWRKTTHLGADGFYRSATPVHHSYSDPRGPAMCAVHRLPVAEYNHNLVKLFSRMTGEDAPVAQGHIIGGSNISETVETKEGVVVHRVSGHQFLDTATFFSVLNVLGAITGRCYPIHPAMFGARLGSLHKLYDYYRAERIRVHVVSVVPTSQAGDMMIWYCPNNSEVSSFMGSQGVSMASVHPSFKQASCWLSFDLDCDLSESLPMYSTLMRAGGQEAFQGYIQTAFNDVSGSFTGVTPADLFITYEFAFFKQRIDPSYTQTQFSQIQLTWPIGTVGRTGSVVVASTSAADAASPFYYPTVTVSASPIASGDCGTATVVSATTNSGPVVWSTSTSSGSLTLIQNINLFFRVYRAADAAGAACSHLAFYLTLADMESSAVEYSAYGGDNVPSAMCYATGFSALAGAQNLVLNVSFFNTDPFGSN